MSTHSNKSTGELSKLSQFEDAALLDTQKETLQGGFLFSSRIFGSTTLAPTNEVPLTRANENAEEGLFDRMRCTIDTAFGRSW